MKYNTMRMLSVAVLVLAVLLAAFSLAVTSLVENNEDVVDIEHLFSVKLTPEDADSIIDLMDMYLDAEDYGEMQTAVTALRIYAVTPMLYKVSAVLAAIGLLGMFTGKLGGKK